MFFNVWGKMDPVLSVPNVELRNQKRFYLLLLPLSAVIATAHLPIVVAVAVVLDEAYNVNSLFTLLILILNKWIFILEGKLS